MNDSRQSGPVSAVVPARNEEAVIRACVESLVQQQDIVEVIVVDDESSDNTPSIIGEIMNDYPEVRLMQTRELPAGWVGKNHAVWIGAREAQGEWLLFTDADAVHQPDSAKCALAIAARENAVMISFSPEQVMETWYEKALIPSVYSRLAGRFSFADVNDPGKPVAAANGQFLMIRRSVYEALGGHASVAGDVLEDVALAKRIKAAGYRMWFGSGQGIVRVRMYRSFSAMWQGWKKNLYPLMGGQTRAITVEIVSAVWPIFSAILFAVLAGVLTRSWLASLGALAACLIIASIAYRTELKRAGFEPSLAWYGAPGKLLFASVLWASQLAHRRGKLEWKGRAYPAGTPDASK
jgi:glycosyltransferase involved in cell wall biosynthesis